MDAGAGSSKRRRKAPVGIRNVGASDIVTTLLVKWAWGGLSSADIQDIACGSDMRATHEAWGSQ